MNVVTRQPLSKAPYSIFDTKGISPGHAWDLMWCDVRSTSLRI